jgi:hypothetical protein
MLTDNIRRQLEKKGHPDAVSDGPGANISRRPSKRQQEKAPEGRAPHVPSDDVPAHGDQHEADAPVSSMNAHKAGGGDAGPAPVESKFQEELE